MDKKEFFMYYYNKNVETDREEVGVKLDGFVLPLKDGKQIGHNEFLDKFIDFLESEGWSFTGLSVQINADGNEIKDIDE
ncbi:hypothetical protein [Alkalibacillus aidingensis]|uniref:hypothetical protein n=1 Tax=Alkalibacillus aidingensis TaxID=2747607 RepID=UPI001660190D|nr:hypothetical protein [Alkalibacillus aidingensis]